MNYLTLEQYPKAWIFRHQDLPVSEADKLLIRPLTEHRAEQIWREHVSRDCSHPEHFAAPDWAADDSTWSEKEFWQSSWDAQSNALPELLEQHFSNWAADTTIYFCYQSDHIIETKWDVFVRNWKNFLFFDSGPILIGRKRKEVAQFFEDGTYKIGKRKY